MNSKKKLIFIIGIILIIGVLFVNTNSKKPASSKTEKAEVSEQKAEQSIIDPEDLAAKGDTKADPAQVMSSPTPTADPNLPRLIYQNFSYPNEQLVFPLGYLYPQAEQFLKKIIQVKSLDRALKGLVGHGYISFPVQEVEAYYPQLIKVFLKDFASAELPDYFWNEIAGAGVIYFRASDLASKMQQDLTVLGLKPEFVSFTNSETLKIDLNNAGYKVRLEDSVQLNYFLNQHQELLNAADVRAEGTIAIMLTSLAPLRKNCEQVILDLNQSDDLGKFVKNLKVDGLLLLDVKTLTLYQSEFGDLINVNKMKAAGMVMQKTPFDTFTHQLDFQKLVKNQDVNMVAQQQVESIQKEAGIEAKFFQTYLDLPLRVTGERLIRFSRSIHTIQLNFMEQKLFAPGTVVTSEFDVPVESLGEKIEPTYVEVLNRIDAGRLIEDSLAHIEGQGIFTLPILLEKEHFDKLSSVLNAAAAFVEKHSPRPDHKIYLEFVSTPELNALLDSDKYVILSRDSFDGKSRLLLTSGEPLKIQLLQDFAKELMKQDVVLKGYVDINLAVFGKDRHAVSLVQDLREAGTLSFEAILKGIKGTGILKLYPNTEKFFNDELMNTIFTLFKNNQKAYERWKLINASFNFRIPETFSKEYPEGSLRDMYEYINKDQTPKGKEQRVKNLITALKQGSANELVVPETLDEILEVLSDDRKISDVLKDKQDEGF